MKSMFRIYPLGTKTIGVLTLALGATPTCQASGADSYSRRTWHFKPFVILMLSLAGNCGGSLNTLQVQESGFPPGAVGSVTRFRGRHQGESFARSFGGFTIAVILVVGVGEHFVEPEGSGLAAPARLIEQC